MKKSVILCVDDEKLILNSLKTELKECFGNQYLIEFCDSSLEAIELVESFLTNGYARRFILNR